MRVIKPASEMLFDDDCLQLTKFADQLEQYLYVDHLFTSGSLVIGLEAPFGSGKTAFLSMWFRRMQEQRSEKAEGPIPVLLNAWEDDFVSDPFLSIVLSLVDEVEKLQAASAVQLGQLKAAAKQFAWFGVGLANSFVRSSTGVDAVAAGNLAEEKAPKHDARSVEIFALHNVKKQSFKDLKTELQKLLGSDDQVKAIICIDELDRCRPDYAIQYLETIKHIFDIPGIAFVLAIDKEQVSSSARALFGADLNATEYLRKFIARSFHLPKPDENGIRSLVQKNYDRFMVIENVRDSEFKESYLRDRAKELCVGFDFTLRQIEDLFRLLGHVFSSEKPTGRIYSSWIHGYLFLCCLKIREPKFYFDFCCGTLGPLELMDLLKGKMRDSDVQRWTCICYSGMYAGGESPGFYEFLKQEGILKDDSMADTRMEQHFSQNWGHGAYGNCIRRIFDRIESATSI